MIWNRRLREALRHLSTDWVETSAREETQNSSISACHQQNTEQGAAKGPGPEGEGQPARNKHSYLTRMAYGNAGLVDDEDFQNQR
jgi:hypothetical protein